MGWVVQLNFLTKMELGSSQRTLVGLKGGLSLGDMNTMVHAMLLNYSVRCANEGGAPSIHDGVRG